MSTLMNAYPSVDAEQHTVLLVANNRRNARKLSTPLTDAGYRVRVGDDDTTLEGLLGSIQPDIVVLSGSDTLQHCQQIKAIDSGIFRPIIAILDRSESAQRLEFVRCGTDGILVRPIDNAELVALAQSLLNIKTQFKFLKTRNHELAHDLAERNQQLETAVRRLQDLDQMKTTLVRNVSHELRTPLLQVKSSIALLREDIPTGTQGSELIEMAVQAIGRLESTVASITQLSESQNQKLEPVVLNDSIDLAIRSLQRRWAIHDTRRIKKLYSRRIPPVIGDKRGIAQVLQHLLDNGLKFSPDGGPVEILIEAQADDTVWIAVQDYGIGIEEHDIAHVFDTFYQVDPSTTRSFNGVGAGLSIAQLIAEGMNSHIEVISAPGKGSTFAFRLPQANLSQ